MNKQISVHTTIVVNEYHTRESRYSKTCVKRPLSKDRKFVFETNYRLMQVKRIAEAFCNTFDLQ